MEITGASEIVKNIKRGLIDVEDTVMMPEIYLTNGETDEIIQFCMLPEELRVRYASSFRTYNIIERGEVKIPKGEQLTQISWSGLLPNARMLYYNFLKHEAWEQPLEIIRALTRWREDGNKIRLLITQTPVNFDVYLKNFETDYKKSMVGINYSIDFIAAKELKILTIEEADAQREQAAQHREYEIRRRAAMKSKIGIYFGRVNSIWEAAKILTGNGANWEALMERNDISDFVALDPTDYLIWG